jgi:endonuclease G
MERMIRRLKVNALLFVGLFIATLICAAIFNEEILHYELPKIKSSQPEKIVTHIGYTVSFNTNWKIPNWVAYELTSEEVQGVEPRDSNFLPDPKIKESPSTDDYENSGYDRGHMAPAADMKWSKQAMTESFYTSNICPQNNNLNKGIWKNLEEHIRSVATKYDHIYIACGPIVSLTPKTIAHNTISVPDAFFKVILRQKEDSWSAIGFMMPNQAEHKPLNKYAMSIDDIEIITDIDFFVDLPDSIENKIEATCNLSDWDL